MAGAENSEADPRLLLVATPIGNIADISLRALEVLGKADVVASEDTRKTGVLLKRHGIKKPQISFHEHNEARASEKILELLRDGRRVAVVSNAGTPGVSDPGFALVRKALEEGIPFSLVPGPCALVSALVLSGLPSHSFTFRGFPPRKPGARKRFLAADRDSPHTLVLYESPYRLLGLLRDALDVFGDRRAAVAAEITKMFERVERGTLSSIIASLESGRIRGEYTVVIEGATSKAS